MSSSGLNPPKKQVHCGLVPPLSNSSHKRAWRVIHACEYARDVLAVVEGQVAAGMRPYIVTPQGAGSAELYLTGGRQEQPRALSLLRSWQDVRNWRKSILDCDPENSADLVHAHCFAAGMAAVRNIGGVVYDLGACIEELAISAGQCEAGSWMARSFRVAEQFVLSRAAAVIVHSVGMKDAAQERGAPAESIFLIPDPLPFEDDVPLPTITRREQDEVLRSRLGLGTDTVGFLAPQFAAGESTELRPEQLTLLESFALALKESPGLRLLVEGVAAEPVRNAIRECAVNLGIADNVSVIDPADSIAAWQSTDVVIATGTPPPDPVAARRANEVCLAALCRGKALLAADLPGNREVSPDGRGCLWFEHDNARDLAARLAFLGGNPGFRTALATTGRSYILETRNSSAIGHKYREAYLHAFNRKRSTGPGTGIASLRPATNWS
jgi:glycosyltransferase involved in cell wall biosynthesis